MSDLETMIAMLDRAKIAFLRETAADESCKDSQGNTLPKGSIRLTVERGYTGFEADFIFSPSGDLLDVAAYE